MANKKLAFHPVGAKKNNPTTKMELRESAPSSLLAGHQKGMRAQPSLLLLAQKKATPVNAAN